MPCSGQAKAEAQMLSMQPTPKNTATSDPKCFEGSADALEVLVTRDQGCLPGLGEGGGEAIRVGQVLLPLETGVPPCGIAEFHVNADNLNGRLGDILQLGGGGFFTAWTASYAARRGTE